MTLKRFMAIYMATSFSNGAARRLMRDTGARRLVDKPPDGKTGKVERAADLVMAAGRHQMREQRAAGRNRLEAAGAPAAIQEDPRRRSRSDDRRRIRNDIDDPAPLPHQLQLAEGGEHVEQAGNDDLLHRRGAALAVGRNAVEAAAEHELALVRLAGVDAGSEMKKNDVEARLDRLADHRLQRIGMNRQPDAGFGHQL